MKYHYTPLLIYHVVNRIDVAVAELFNSLSNYVGRMLKGSPFLTLFAISCAASLASNMVSFPTIYYWGKRRTSSFCNACSLCAA
jgi:hypothetical protein